MSIYLRYAIYSNCMRYLGELEQIKEIALKCRVIDDSEETSTVQPAEDTAAPQLEYQNADGANDGEGDDEWESVEYSQDSQDSRDSREDSEHNREHDQQDSQEADECNAASDSEWDTTETESPSSGTATSEDGSVNDAEVDRGYEADSSEGDDQFDVSFDDEENNNGRSEGPADNSFEEPLYTIKKSHLDRLFKYHRVLTRMTDSLSKNMDRVKSNKNSRSSHLISHLWGEANRLNGSEPAKLPPRDGMSTDWWYDEQDQYGNRRRRSPLAMQFTPDDLLWDEETKNWQLDTGRATDDEGRRFIKL